MIGDVALYLRARLALAFSEAALASSRLFDRWSAAAVCRAGIAAKRAGALSDRLVSQSRIPRPHASGDLLHGSKAIAAHLGVSKGVTRHLIRSGAIPWFPLAGVACARRSVLADHFAALEADSRQRGG